MSDGEVDIRLLALRRQQQRRKQSKTGIEPVILEPSPDNYARLSSGRSAYEATPVKAYSVPDSPRNGIGNTPRRNSHLGGGSITPSLFDEDTRIGRMHVPPLIKCECNGIEAYALISTSETVSTISMNFVRKLRLVDQILPDASPVFNPLSLHQPDLKGKVKYVDLVIGSWQQVAQFNVVENYLSDVTLGIDFLRRTQSVVNFGDSFLFVGGTKGERVPFLTSREVMSLTRRNSNKPHFIIGNGTFSESE